MQGQIDYAKHMLAVTEINELSWKIASDKPLAEILHLISCFKSIGCTAFFLFDKKFSEEVKILLDDNLRYLLTDHFKLILKTTLDSFSVLVNDTHSNIDQFARLVMKRIVKFVLVHT